MISCSASRECQAHTTKATGPARQVRYTVTGIDVTDRDCLRLGYLFLLHLVLQLLISFVPFLLLVMLFLGTELALDFGSQALLAGGALVLVLNGWSLAGLVATPTLLRGLFAVLHGAKGLIRVVTGADHRWSSLAGIRLSCRSTGSNSSCCERVRYRVFKSVFKIIVVRLVYRAGVNSRAA